MKISKRLLAGLAIAVTSIVNNAQADIVEPFTGGELSSSWSNPIGTDAQSYGISAAPDGTFGTVLSDGVWSVNTSIPFVAGETLSAWINPSPSPAIDNNAQGGRLYLGFNAGTTDAYSFVAASDTNQLGFQNNTGYTTPSFGASAVQNYLDQWYFLTIGLSADGGSATANIYNTDGTTLLSTVTESGLSSSNTGIALRGIGGAAITSLSITAVPLPAAIWLFTPVSGFLLMLSRRRKALV